MAWICLLSVALIIIGFDKMLFINVNELLGRIPKLTGGPYGKSNRLS